MEKHPYVVRPCGTFCAHPLRYNTEETARQVARHLTEHEFSQVRVSQEEEIAPDCWSIKPLGYYYRDEGKVSWLSYEGPEPTAAEIIGNQVRGYRQAA